MPEFRIAKRSDKDAVMAFINNHWRQGHIMARDARLFLHEFAYEDELNLGIAVNSKEEVQGIFGFMRYNNTSMPDLAGSFWAAVERAEFPMLGIRLRNFVMRTVPHRFFAAPGAGVKTRDIYKLLGMRWCRMKQCFILNPLQKNYGLVKLPDTYSVDRRQAELPSDVKVATVENVDELHRFPFESYKMVLPYKDAWYVKTKFFDHPYYKYRCHVIEKGGDPLSMFVTRLVEHNNKYALRVVDFYGNTEGVVYMGEWLRAELEKKGYEYADFINYGIEDDLLKEGGFDFVRYKEDAPVVPHYFEPFEQRNVELFCVADYHSGDSFRMFKADGDQDRPNIIPREVEA